jgi:UDP-GlcNAc3NAcA epimerase
VNLAAEGLAVGATLVGDVLYDLAARTSSEIADPAVLIGIEASLRSDAPDLRLRPGGFVLATVHRAANRNVAAVRAWADLLGAIARPERPVVLPLHPGTAAALAAADILLSDNVRVVQPIGYRTSLALQLHGAAVVTDSGGIQREAAWLGVPCLILRDTTEWTDVVAEMGGLMVVVGLDAERAQAELARLAPVDETERIAADRAAWLDLQPSGAAEAIVDALETIPGALDPTSLP